MVRRRQTASIDFGRVDALAGALEMNNLIVQRWEAVVIPTRLFSQSRLAAVL